MPMLISAVLYLAVATEAPSLDPLTPPTCQEQRASDMAFGVKLVGFGAPLILSGTLSLIPGFVAASRALDTDPAPGTDTSNGLLWAIAGLGVVELIAGGILMHNGSEYIKANLADTCPPMGPAENKAPDPSPEKPVTAPDPKPEIPETTPAQPQKQL